MLNKISAIFSSLLFRIFISFWLITLISVISIQWFSKQLAEDFTILRPIPEEMQKLDRIGARLSTMLRRRPDTTIRSLLASTKKSPRHIQLWLKDLTTNQVFTLVKFKHQPISKLLNEQNFDAPVSIHLKDYQLIGPTDLLLNDKPVQLFIGHRGPSRIRPSFFRSLPTWARIAIPLFVSLLLCGLLSWSITRQLRALQATSKKLGDGDLTARVDNSRFDSDETRSLALSFNTMAAQLEQSVTAQQRLLADVSHELRSPLTRMQIALALAQSVKPQTKDLAKHLSRFELEITRLDQMIADILHISRLENSIQHLHIELTNISAITKQIVDDAKVLADNKNITINASITTGIELNGDGQFLASSIENILTNAIKYSPESSIITLTLMKNSDSIILTIRDTGPGVPESTLVNLFEPFFRVNDARDRQSGGCGLGLAIAKRAIIAHKGTISAINDQGGGLKVTICLPINLQ